MDEPTETNLGLLGPIVVTGRGRARPYAAPAEVEREFILLFMIFNENRGTSDKLELGLLHSINGYVFGNLPGLSMRNSERVRWYLLGMGNEADLHSAHWPGKTLRFQGRNTDVVELLPGPWGERGASDNGRHVTYAQHGLSLLAARHTEPPDVYEYAMSNLLFPHESTVDQFFTESQFESYRMLGLHAVRRLLEGGTVASVAELMHRADDVSSP